MRAAVVVAAFALTLATADACAQTQTPARDDDGVYGRFDGDLVLSAEALGAVADANDNLTGTFSVTLRARALEMVGVALGYDRAFVATRHDALWMAVDLRPTWLARFAYDLQRGPRWLDLTIDSIGLELGAAWVRPGEPIGAGSGVGFVLGGGVELPLMWQRGDGVFVRLGVRWITSRVGDAQGTGANPANDALLEAGVGLVLRTLVDTGSTRLRH
jgi:hypothetical protein